MVAGKEVRRLVSIETHQATKTALGKNQRRFFIYVLFHDKNDTPFTIGRTINIQFILWSYQ
jgi:hypothetical protein